MITSRLENVPADPFINAGKRFPTAVTEELRRLANPQELLNSRLNSLAALTGLTTSQASGTLQRPTLRNAHRLETTIESIQQAMPQSDLNVG